MLEQVGVYTKRFPCIGHCIIGATWDSIMSPNQNRINGLIGYSYFEGGLYRRERMRQHSFSN